MVRSITKPIILVLLFTILVISSIPSSDGDAVTITSIDEAYYTNDTGMLEVSGKSNEDTLWMFIEDLESESRVSPYAFTTPVNGAWEESIKLDLMPGTYKVVVFSNSTDAVWKNFTVYEDESSPSITISSNELILYIGDSMSSTLSVTLNKVNMEDVVWICDNTNVIKFVDNGKEVDFVEGKSQVDFTIHSQNAIDANITVLVKNTELSDSCKVSLKNVPEPTVNSTFTFQIKMKMDWDKADWGSSGFSEDDLKTGITLTGVGTNAGEALENACDANGIPNEFISTHDGNNNDLRYWVVQIFGLGDVPLEGGDWKYWVQEHNGEYNQKTLGWYYDNSGTYSLRYDITSVDYGNEVERIYVKEQPDKTEYKVGESFDPTGMVVMADMSVGEDLQVYKYDVSPETFTEAGDQKVTLTYRGQSATVDVTVTDPDKPAVPKVVSIEVTDLPDKTVYDYGESFDGRGMTVTATMSDKTTVAVTGYSVSPETFAEHGTVEVTVTYEGKTDTFTVTVNPVVQYIEVTSPPDKTEYKVGESLETDGIVVSAVMSDGTTEEVDAHVPDVTFASAGEKVVTVSYEGRTAEFSVTVSDPIEIPEVDVDPEDEKVEVDENPDGSTTTTTTVDTVDKDGNSVKKTETVTVKEDGSSEGTKTESVTDREGNTVDKTTVTSKDKDGNVREEVTVTSEDTDGSKTKVESISELDRDGNGKTETKTTVTKTDGTTVETAEVTEKTDKGSKKTTESTVTDKDRVTESTVTETKDAEGKTTGKQTEFKATETLKDAEGNDAGTMKTEIRETVDKEGKSEKTEEVVAESKDGNVKTETTSKIGKDGKTEAESKTTLKSESGREIGSDVIDGALKQSEQTLKGITADRKEVKKTVEVEVSEGTSAALSPEAVKKVSDYGAGLKVSGSEGSIDTDSDVLKNLAGDGTKSVELSMEANNKDVLKDKQKDIVGDNHFVDLNALVGGENVHQLGGKAVITFGYQLKDGESAVDMKVFYVDDEGNKTLVDATFANGSFTMTVDHFSVYMVENTAAPAPVDPETPEDKDEGGISPVLIAGIVIVVIAAIAGIVFYMRKS